MSQNLFSTRLILHGVSCSKIGKKATNTVAIVDKPLRSQMQYTDKIRPVNNILSNVHTIWELSFRDMDCGNYSISTIIDLSPLLNIVWKLHFDNCFFVFARNFLADTARLYKVKNIKIVSASVIKVNVQSVINNKFFSLYLGDFEFTVKEKKNISKMKPLVTDQTLIKLMGNPRRVFKLENVRNDFTSSWLGELIETSISNNWKVDWDLGVLVVRAEDVACFHKLVHTTLAQRALAANVDYTSNWYCIDDDEKTHFEEYIITGDHFKIKFTTQLDQYQQMTSRKRPHQ